jgi:hypothetical protein
LEQVPSAQRDALGASLTPARATLSQSTVSQNPTSAVGKSATCLARRMFWKTPRAAKERCSPRTVRSDEIDAQLDESANALIASDGTVWIIPHLGEQRLLDFSILSGADLRPPRGTRPSRNGDDFSHLGSCLGTLADRSGMSATSPGWVGEADQATLSAFGFRLGTRWRGV